MCLRLPLYHRGGKDAGGKRVFPLVGQTAPQIAPGHCPEIRTSGNILRRDAPPRRRVGGTTRPRAHGRPAGRPTAAARRRHHPPPCPRPAGGTPHRASASAAPPAPAPAAGRRGGGAGGCGVGRGDARGEAFAPASQRRHAWQCTVPSPAASAWHGQMPRPYTAAARRRHHPPPCPRPAGGTPHRGGASAAPPAPAPAAGRPTGRPTAAARRRHHPPPRPRPAGPRDAPPRRRVGGTTRPRAAAPAHCRTAPQVSELARPGAKGGHGLLAPCPFSCYNSPTVPPFTSPKGS